MSEVTRLLNAVEQGDPKAAGELLPLVYQELRRLATHRMANEAAGHTLQPTALVHEAWLRLVGGGQEHFQNRAHFFAAAAEAMRHILVDNARRKRARRHGGGQDRVDVAEADNVVAPEPDDSLLAVHEALDEFARVDKQKAELVKLRYFAGFTLTEAADILGMSEPTAKRHWAYAKAWLHQEMSARQTK